MMEYKFGKYGVQCWGGAICESGRVADFPLVGSNLKQSNEFCNVFSRNLGCLRDSRHVGKVVPVGVYGQKSFDGKVPDGKALIFVRAFHCDDPLCPVCCFNWAKKEAKRVMMRFDVFSQVYGEGFSLEHVTVSVPEFDWDKDLKFLRKQASAFVGAVGVVGSCCIYHPKRYNECLDCWYFSPHFHFVGFIEGGLVDGLCVRDVHNLSGYVLKKLGKRKSVIGTLLYQLSHAGVPSGRQHAVTWCGELNYRKSVHPDLLELVRANEAHEREVAKGKCSCPICGERMVNVVRVVNEDVGKFNYEGYEDKYVLDDVKNWCVLPVKVFGYG